MSTLTNLLRAAYRISGKKVLHRARRAPSEAAKAKWAGVMEEVAERGIATVPNFWSPEECAAARADFDRLVDAGLEGIWRDDTGSDHRIFGFERVSEHGKRYVADADIAAMKEIYYAADPADLHTFAMMNRVEYRPGNLGSGGGWHRDAVHEQQFKAILYLSDVEPHSGGFEYLRNTHRKSSVYKTILHNRIGAAQDRFTEAEMASILADHGELYPRQKVNGAAGTLVLTDTSGIHRGSPIERGRRYAITQYVFRSAAIGGRGIPANVREMIIPQP